jgi:hypothetical protein
MTLAMDVYQHNMLLTEEYTHITAVKLKESTRLLVSGTVYMYNDHLINPGNSYHNQSSCFNNCVTLSLVMVQYFFNRILALVLKSRLYTPIQILHCLVKHAKLQHRK